MTPKPLHLHSVGQTYHDFKVTKAVDISELQCQLRELIHIPTGAQVMAITNDDPENLFCLSFQTLPDSSNGVAHILEHTVLCGSKKFPVKDPFFLMQRRSLNTYMNALTGSDFTCYPAASQVHKDFYNLLEVYLDAVFRPNLNELSFMQEGHRLEFAVPEDPQSPLEYKGVVFNEMKGVLASPTARLTEAINKTLFPDLTYGFNSGGDPKDIPQLTYQELCAFHKKYYHPSRCLFFFYGNMPLEDHLDFIAKDTLTQAEKVPPLPPLPLQPRFSEPRRVIESYPISSDEETHDKTQIAFGWLTCHVLEQQELLALSILEIILMGTDASPLKMAFLKSGLCKQALCHMESDISEVPVLIVLRGCNPEHADDLEQIMIKTLHKFVQKGISLTFVENAMHQLEFHRSEIVGNHAPFGLSLFMRSVLLKQHGGLPESGLKIHSLFEELHRRNLEDPHYLTNLIKKYFLNNTHFVRVVITPDKTLASKELAEEKAILADIGSQLTKEKTKDIVKKAVALKAFQKKQEEENLDILPKVTLDDVSKSTRNFILTQEKIGNLEVFHHSCFTNEIVYAELIFDLPEIAEADLSFVRLFAILITQMGCANRTYAENLEYIQAHTGGIEASLTLNLQAQDHRQFSPSFYLRGKALHRKVNKLFSLLRDTASSVDFTDVGRLKEVLLKHYTGLQSALNQNALKYATNLSSSGLDVPSKIANKWYGLEYFWKIKEIAKHFDKHSAFITNKLQELQNKMLCLENPHLVLGCDAAIYDEIKGHGIYGLQDIETKPYIPWKGNYSLNPVYSQGRLIASPIAFISKVMKTVSYVHLDAPALNIAAFLFENLTLHTHLREQGGAYGGGAISSTMAGNFYFYAYRDPNIVSSIEAFEYAIKELLEGHFEDSDLEEAKLEMVQLFDAPIAPGSRADLAYGWLREGKTLEVRQSFRDRLLSVTRDDVISAVQKQIVPNFESSATIVFAGKELLEKENDKLIAQGKKPLTLETV
jgi:presequence protease